MPGAWRAVRPARPGVGVGLVLANLVGRCCCLAPCWPARLTRVWVERRRGSAGSRLHVRLVLLFSGVAVAPTIMVACFAVAFFHFGIQAWFNDPVREALAESLQVVARLSGGAPRQHPRRRAGDGQRPDAMPASSWPPTRSAFAECWATQTTLRGLTEAVIYDPLTGQVMAAAGCSPAWASSRRRRRDRLRRAAASRGARCQATATRVHAVVQLDSTPPLMLMIGRPVDPQILEHMARTEQAVAEYSGSTRTGPGCRSPSPGSSRWWRCWCCWRRC